MFDLLPHPFRLTRLALLAFASLAACDSGVAIADSHGPTIAFDRPFFFFVLDRPTRSLLSSVACSIRARAEDSKDVRERSAA